MRSYFVVHISTEHCGGWHELCDEVDTHTRERVVAYGEGMRSCTGQQSFVQKRQRAVQLSSTQVIDATEHPKAQQEEKLKSYTSCMCAATLWDVKKSITTPVCATNPPVANARRGHRAEKSPSPVCSMRTPPSARTGDKRPRHQQASKLNQTTKSACAHDALVEQACRSGAIQPTKLCVMW